MEKTMMMRITLLLVVALIGGADRSAAQEKVDVRGITSVIKLDEVLFGHLSEFNKLKIRATGRLAPAERKRASRMLAGGEMSAEEFAVILGDARAAINLDPERSVRSDEKGSRKRTLFCRMMSSLVHDSTGRWHDAEVQELCAIAFDCGDVSVDMVRSARRKSTRRKRRR
jgi:hypothetical protein